VVGRYALALVATVTVASCLLRTLVSTGVQRNLFVSHIVGVNYDDTAIRTIYRVYQEECEILRESVPYVKLYRYNPKHLYPKLNGYGDNGKRI